MTIAHAQKALAGSAIEPLNPPAYVVLACPALLVQSAGAASWRERRLSKSQLPLALLATIAILLIHTKFISVRTVFYNSSSASVTRLLPGSTVIALD